MSQVRDAFHPFAPNREQERNQRAPGPYFTLVKYPKMGFCECCGKHKPAPSVRFKGWKCADCTTH